MAGARPNPLLFPKSGGREPEIPSPDLARARVGPWFTVKVAADSVVELVVTVPPTFVHELPEFEDFHSSHVLMPFLRSCAVVPISASSRVPYSHRGHPG